MAGISLYPDGDYDPLNAWGSATNDRAAWEATFRTGSGEQQRIAQSMITASMATPNDEIRAKLSVPPPPAPSGLRKVSPTLSDVLGAGPTAPPSPHLYDRTATDFSGTNAGRDGTSGPSLSSW